MSLHITVIQGSILDANAEVIVNAANSHGFMGGGVAGVIKRAAFRSSYCAFTMDVSVDSSWDEMVAGP